MTNKNKNWFEVDRDGLSKILADRGRAQLIVELIANAWDESGTTRVDVSIDAMPGVPYVEVTIADDAPEGFRDLSHAFTLFAPSYKVQAAAQRGRYNLGEKLVLAVCEWATVTSTTGSVRFDEGGRAKGRTKRAKGTEFRAKMRMTRVELCETHMLLERLIGVEGIETRVQIAYGPSDTRVFRVEPRGVVTTVTETLPTVLADDEGYLRRTARKTTVDILTASADEGWVYELGIPVVSIGGPYDVNVKQKVPLNTDRDNVPPSYRRKLRQLVLDATAGQLDDEQARDEWVTDALPLASDDAVTSVLDRRFGPKRVSYDPSDPEANSLAASRGYTVVHGGSLSREAWGRVREADALKPAGQVTPSPKQEFSATGEDVILPEDKWPDGARFIADRFRELARYLLGVEIDVRLASRLSACTAACYGDRTLIVSLCALGRAWFERAKSGRLDADHLDLLVHELGHELSEDHYSERYHNALTSMAGRLAVWAAMNPGWVATDSAATDIRV